MADKDPGNSQPDEWTEDLDEADADEVRALLAQEFGEEGEDGDTGSGN